MRKRETILFSETQALGQRHSRVLLAFPPAAIVFITCRQIIWHKPWGTPPLSNGDLIFLTVLLVAVYFRLITVKLVTKLGPHEVSAGLRGLWKRSGIPLEEIRSAAAVNYDPAADFGGYGIRSGRRGTAYIARGNRAVELVLANGQKVLDRLARSRGTGPTNQWKFASR
jgi:hypothetical protein